MSPLISIFDQTAVCFPRVSGDEPGSIIFKTRITSFSPRERG